MFRMFVILSFVLARAALAQETTFQLSAHQRLTWDGKVVDAKVERNRHGETDVKPEGIEFSVIPTRMMTVDTWNNPVTGGVEQRIRGRIEHPIPVLRAAHVRFYDKTPDLAPLAIDIVQKDGNEVEIQNAHPIAIVGDGASRVMMITFSEITIPKDKPEEWRLAGTIKPIVLVDHIADPVADRGRAVLAKEALPLSGKIIYGVRDDAMKPTTFLSLDLANGASKRLAAGIVEGRISQINSIVERADMRTLQILGKGRVLRQIAVDSDINEFAISPDGSRVALSTERFVDVPNDIPRREIVTIVYGLDGQKIGEVVGYDDPAFFPDGRLLLTGVSAGEGLFIADLKSGKVSRIEIKDAIDDEEAKGPWWPRTPAVSPDGKWVTYVSRRDAYVVGIDGKGWTPVWTREFHEPQSTPVFSPDSKFVAFVLTQLNVMNGPGEIVVVDLAKRVRQHLPLTKDANSEVPIMWIP